MNSPEAHSTRKRLIAFFGLLLLTACGQTGALYLPEGSEPDSPETEQQEPQAQRPQN